MENLKQLLTVLWSSRTVTLLVTSATMVTRSLAKLRLGNLDLYYYFLIKIVWLTKCNISDKSFGLEIMVVFIILVLLINEFEKVSITVKNGIFPLTIMEKTHNSGKYPHSWKIPTILENTHTPGK